MLIIGLYFLGLGAFSIGMRALWRIDNNYVEEHRSNQESNSKVMYNGYPDYNYYRRDRYYFSGASHGMPYIFFAILWPIACIASVVSMTVRKIILWLLSVGDNVAKLNGKELLKKVLEED